LLNASTAATAPRSGCHEPKERTMKTLPILLAGVLASASVVAQTASAPEPRRGEGWQHHRERAEAKFAEADSNHDGAISQSEWQSARLREANEHFQKMDGNRDGKLSREEMQSAREQRMGGHRREERRERMRALDTDGDQQLSRAEIGDSMPKLAQDFDRIDANRDGKLSREEMRGAREMRRGETQR
jgi:Ca2+-binding EF-hand superfamily protein